MITYALFIGCQIPARVQQYETSARAILNRLEVKVKDFRLFNCCGYPMRNADESAFLLSAAKNLALAELSGLDILTLCKCCFGALKAAAVRLEEDEALKADINRRLDPLGLTFTGRVRIKHLLSVLYHDVGVDGIAGKVVRRFKDLPLAVHYGCHALRPSHITCFDNPVTPSLFDRLVELTGARSIPWRLKLECCGAPLIGLNDNLSMDLTRRKLVDARTGGAEYLCSACPWCQLQFDTVQETMWAEKRIAATVPSILYPQLLGLCLGLNGTSLGLSDNRLDLSDIYKRLKEE